MVVVCLYPQLEVTKEYIVPIIFMRFSDHRDLVVFTNKFVNVQ